jgi:hypothetical protein
MDLTHFAALLMDADGPRDAAERTLRWLKEQYRARAVALWHLDSDRGLVLDLSVGVDDKALEGAKELAARDPDRMARQEPIVDGGRILVPTRPKGSYLYLDGIDARRLNLSVAAEGATVAFNALKRADSPVTYRGRNHGDLFRDELIATLRLHEWNVARVARVKGVTRKTVYDWLDKYAIPREHVRRS